MLWQCRCCGFMTPDHLRISSHMKEMHEINFIPEIVAPLSEDEKDRMGEFAKKLFENSFTSGTDVVRYSAPTEE